MRRERRHDELKSMQGDSEVPVIDHIEPPTEN